MKTRTLYRNSKALSPVIATIILVAVTVAIAIAVAAWLGALTFNYTTLEQINVTGATINISAHTVAFGLSNVGTSDVVMSQAMVTGGSFNNVAATTISGASPCTGTTSPVTVPKGSSCTLTGTFTGTFVAGTSYAFTLISSKGNRFPYTVTA